MQFVRTSLKCSVKYLKISAYIVRSIHNALVKSFIYSNLLSPSHKWFLLSEDEYLGLYLIIFYSWIKKTQTTTTKPSPFFVEWSQPCFSSLCYICILNYQLVLSKDKSRKRLVWADCTVHDNYFVPCCLTVDSSALK